MAKANKFKKERDRVKWAHLNVNLNRGIPAGSTGIFAELVGVQPLSPTTRKLLVRPATTDEGDIWSPDNA